MIAFLTSPLGKWLGTAGLLVIAGLLVWRWDAARIARHEAAAIEITDNKWTARLARAEADARAVIQQKTEAAYRAGIEAEKLRAALDAADDETTATVIAQVIHDSPSASSCVFDRISADALNRLR